MEKRLSFFLVLSLIVFCGLQGLYAQELARNSDERTLDMYHSYLLDGLTSPSLSFPLLPHELAALAGTEAEDGTVLTVKLDGHFHTFFNDRDKNPFTVYDFLDKEPIARLGLGLTDSVRAGFYLEAYARSEFSDDTNTNLFNPKANNPISIENYFIRYGYFYYDFKPLKLTFGRMPVHFGHPEFDTLLPSNRLPYMDSLYLKLPIGFVTMNMVISSLENRKGINDVNPLDQDIVLPADNVDYEFGNDSIMTALHRFDMHWDKLNISFSGFSVISRPDNNFNLGDFFPVFSWHNADVGWHNLSIVFEASYSPFRGMDLYAQAGFDDINVSDLLGIDDTGIPTIDAYIVGAVYKTDLLGAEFSAKSEFGYTHYLWGSFYDGSEGRGNHIFERAIYRYKMDMGNVLMPLTSPYGPGALWVDTDVSLCKLSGFDFNLNLFYLEKINGVDLVSMHYERNDSIREDNGVTRTFDVSVSAAWTPFKWLSLTAVPGIKFSDDGADFHFDFIISSENLFSSKLK